MYLEAPFAGIEYSNFINSIRSEQTKNQYMYCLKRYMQFLNLQNPTELMFSDDIKQIQSHLIDYMVYLKNNVSYSTRNVRLINCGKRRRPVTLPAAVSIYNQYLLITKILVRQWQQDYMRWPWVSQLCI